MKMQRKTTGSSFPSVAAARSAAAVVGAGALAVLLLGGCGQKGPLKLPAPAAGSASAPGTR